MCDPRVLGSKFIIEQKKINLISIKKIPIPILKLVTAILTGIGFIIYNKL